MRSFIKTINYVNARVGVVVSFIMVIMALIIGYEVIMRTFFNMPTLWAHETSGMLFGALFMLGAGYVLSQRDFVRVDILMEHLHPRIQAAIDIVTHLAVFFYLSVVLWKGWHYALQAFIRMEHSNSGWQPVLWPIKWVLVIGMILLILQLVAKYLRDFHMLFTGEEL